VRLSSEQIRDQALAAAGALSDKMYGPPVMPWQPAGIWLSPYNGEHWETSPGSEQYRRGIYTYWKRTAPYPSMVTFDAASREVCTARRIRTNTPLQALVTLNDPTFVEACKVLGEQMTKAGDTRDAMKGVYQKLTAQVPSDQILDLLTGLQKTEEDKFREHPEKAAGWLHAGQYKIDDALDSTRVAADAVVANTILNSDATLTKR